MVTCVLAVCECKCVYKCMYVCVCMDMCVYMCVLCMCVVLCSPHCTCACTHVVTLSSIGFDMLALDYCLVVLLKLWSGAERYAPKRAGYTVTMPSLCTTQICLFLIDATVFLF